MIQPRMRSGGRRKSAAIAIGLFLISCVATLTCSCTEKRKVPVEPVVSLTYSIAETTVVNGRKETEQYSIRVHFSPSFYRIDTPVFNTSKIFDFRRNRVGRLDHQKKTCYWISRADNDKFMEMAAGLFSVQLQTPTYIQTNREETVCGLSGSGFQFIRGDAKGVVVIDSGSDLSKQIHAMVSGEPKHPANHDFPEITPKHGIVLRKEQNNPNGVQVTNTLESIQHDTAFEYVYGPPSDYSERK